jgi:hypothetical protein
VSLQGTQSKARNPLKKDRVVKIPSVNRKDWWGAFVPAEYVPYFLLLRHFFLCFLISILCYSLTGDRLHEEDSAKFSYKQTDMKVGKIKLKYPSILLATYLDNEQKSGNYYYYY